MPGAHPRLGLEGAQDCGAQPPGVLVTSHAGPHPEGGLHKGVSFVFTLLSRAGLAHSGTNEVEVGFFQTAI